MALTELRRLLKDERSVAVVEDAIIFSLIGCLAWLFFALSPFGARSAEIAALKVSSVVGSLSAENSQGSREFEKQWRLKDLSEHLAIGLESARLMYKDEPDVIRPSLLLHKKGAPYSVPDSVARRVYCRHGGQNSRFDDEHFTIRIGASALGCGRETVRLLVRKEPGVLKIRLGKRGSHRLYSIPKTVLIQLRTRLLNGN